MALVPPAGVELLLLHRGACFPIDLEAEDGIYSSSPSSLLYLCARKLVQDSNSLAAVLGAVPRDLFSVLMQSALLDNRELSIDQLVRHWPLKELLLEQVAGTAFRSPLLLLSPGLLGSVGKRAVRASTGLLHSWIKCVSRRSDCKLRTLDLCGYPVAELMLRYACSHLLLVYNQSRHEKLRQAYNWRARALQLPEAKAATGSCETEQTYSLELDIALNEVNDSFSELCKALKLSQLDDCRFRLVPRTVSMQCVQPEAVRVLLEQVDPQGRVQQLLGAVQAPLQYLKLTGCCLAADDFRWLSTELPTSALRELDLSHSSGAVAAAWPCLQVLLQAANCLRSLELERCSLPPAAAACLCDLLQRSPLRFLNLGGSSWPRQPVLDLVRAAAGCLTLRGLKMTLPDHCFRQPEEEEMLESREVVVISEEKARFDAEVQDVLDTHFRFVPDFRLHVVFLTRAT